MFVVPSSHYVSFYLLIDQRVATACICSICCCVSSSMCLSESEVLLAIGEHLQDPGFLFLVGLVHRPIVLYFVLFKLRGLVAYLGVEVLLTPSSL